jgi:hypothetical protein
MSTSLKSSRNDMVQLPEHEAEKNDRRICPINDDLAWTLAWTTPKTAFVAGGLRASHRPGGLHDA